ncbi:hypothetical protein BDN71DRAFT_937992 [Pleurotus eryngii]|uniref:Pheromone n=1 Tax=Pleurotus eryngii TaxID=5323 RepID=A0A9P6D6L8_PLEER|nr:hypothetical protein BDN71DRAFT_937992 [Pleurotus eryngii]
MPLHCPSQHKEIMCRSTMPPIHTVANYPSRSYLQTQRKAPTLSPSSIVQATMDAFLTFDLNYDPLTGGETPVCSGVDDDESMKQLADADSRIGYGGYCVIS